MKFFLRHQYLTLSFMFVLVMEFVSNVSYNSPTLLGNEDNQKMKTSSKVKTTQKISRCIQLTQKQITLRFAGFFPSSTQHNSNFNFDLS